MGGDESRGGPGPGTAATVGVTVAAVVEENYGKRVDHDFLTKRQLHRRVGKAGLEHVAGAATPPTTDFDGQPHSNPAAAQSGFEPAGSAGPSRAPDFFASFVYGQPHGNPAAAQSGFEPPGGAGPSQAPKWRSRHGNGQPHSKPIAQSGLDPQIA